MKCRDSVPKPVWLRAVIAAGWLLLLVGLVAMLFGPFPVSAQAPQALPWEHLPIEGPVLHLFAPPSGALFAQTTDGLLRSTDAGTTWEPISLPDSGGGTRKVTVHPTDPQTILSSSVEGLAKTSDGGATWATVYTEPGQYLRVMALAQSYADPNLLYATFGNGSSYRLIRTQDAGATWETLDQPQADLCSWQTTILYPHPTDPDRVFVSSNCTAGRSMNGTLEMRADRGARVDGQYRAGTGQLPVAWSGGLPPGRFLMALGDLGNMTNTQSSGVEIQRTDDDGHSWTMAMGLNSTSKREGEDIPIQPVRFTVAGLVQDPGSTDYAYVGINLRLPRGRYEMSRIVRSTFHRLAGGQTFSDGRSGYASWDDIGIVDRAELNDLALSVDGQYLYAATETGLWRLPQPSTRQVT